MLKILNTYLLIYLSFNFAYLQAQHCTQDILAQKAKRQKETGNAGDGQVCANVAQFYAFLCECKNKPRSADQARNLKSTLQKIKQSYNSYGLYCTGFGKLTENIPDCKVGNANGNNYTNDPEKNSHVDGTNPKSTIINTDIQSMLNNMAIESNDPLFKKMVSNMQANSEWIAKFKDFEMDMGIASQRDIDFYDFTENAAQAVELGVFIFNKIKERQAKKEAERQAKMKQLQQIQEQSDQYIGQINKLLNKFHQKIGNVPVYTSNTQEEVESLKAFPERFKAYEKLTASKRLLVIRYLASQYIQSIDDLENWQANIEQTKAEQGINAILNEIDEYTRDDPWYQKNYPFLLNEKKSFKSSYNSMYFQLAGIYQKMGNEDSSQYYLNRVSNNIPINEVIGETVKAYKAKNYQWVNALKPNLQYFIQEYGIKTNYPEIPYVSASSQVQQYFRFDYWVFTQYIGIISSIKSGNLQQAKAELNMLIATIRSYSMSEGSTDENQKVLLASQFYTDIANGILLSRQGNHDEATNIIEQNVQYIDGSFSLNVKDTKIFSELWASEVKMEYCAVLINAGLYAEAIEVLKNINSYESYKTNLAMDINFHKALALYKNGEPQRALNSIMYLEALGNVTPKTYMLKADIHSSLGNDLERQLATQKYNEIQNSQ